MMSTSARAQARQRFRRTSRRTHARSRRAPLSAAAARRRGCLCTRRLRRRRAALQDPKPWPKPWPQAWPWWCALVGLALAQGSTKAHQGLAQGTAKAWWCLGDETSFKKAGISNEIAILISSKVCNPDYTILITQLLANNERTQHSNAGSPASRWRSGTRGGRRPSARRR